jgi:hypothetical protein
MGEKDWRAKCLAKRRFWQAQVKSWEKSGLSQNEYCRRNQLRNTQFTYWKKKFIREAAAPVSFVPVPVAGTEPAVQGDDSGLTLYLGDIRIQLASDFNPASLSKILVVLGVRV